MNNRIDSLVHSKEEISLGATSRTRMSLKVGTHFGEPIILVPSIKHETHYSLFLDNRKEW